MSNVKVKKYCPDCGEGVWMTEAGWTTWPWATHACLKEMEMTNDEVIAMIATLEQENNQLRARNERLEEALAKIIEIIEDNKR